MIDVIHPGLMTSVQDDGRHGYQAMGIIENGVMDRQSAAIANMLVGNQETQAVIEICMLGSELLFKVDAAIVLTGACIQALINHEIITINQLIYIKKGSRLKITQFINGVYAYIAIAGGIKVANVLGEQKHLLKS